MSQNNGEDMVQPPTENLSSGFREAEEQPAVNKSETSAEGARRDGRTKDSLQGKVATSLEGLLSVEQADIFTYSGNQGQAIEAQDSAARVSAAAEQYGGAGTSANATIDVKSQPPKLSGTDGGEVTPSESASQVGSRHVDLLSKASSASVARTQAEAYKRQRDVARQKLRDSQREIEQLQDQLEKLQDAQLESDQQIRVREKELCQSRIQFREMERARRSQAIAQEKEVQQLRAQIQEVESKSARAIAQKDQEITDNLNSVRRANQSVQRRKGQIQDLQEENQSLQDRLCETQKMLDVYSEQAADLAIRLEPDNTPVNSQIRPQVISTHAATGDQTGTTAPQSSAQFGTFYAPPSKVKAPPFQQTGSVAATNLDPTIVGATNLKTTLLAGNSSSSAAQIRSTPASAGRFKMDIPSPEKLDKGQKVEVSLADAVVILDECEYLSVEAYNQQTAKASGVGEWAADFSNQPVITGKISETCDTFCDFIEVGDVHADFCDSYTLDPDSDATCSVLGLESPGFETEKCKILAIARAEYIDSCGGQKSSCEVQMDKSDGHNLAIARGVYKNNQTELSDSRIHVDAKYHNRESVKQDVESEKCLMRSIDHKKDLVSKVHGQKCAKLSRETSCRPLTKTVWQFSEKASEICTSASQKDETEIDVVRPEIESFRSRSSSSNSADPQWYQGIVENPIQHPVEFLDGSSHTMKSGCRSFAVRVRIARIDALSLDIAGNKLRLSSHLVITCSPASAAYCVPQEISILKYFQVLALKMANKKRKSSDKKESSGKSDKGKKKPEKTPTKQQQGQKGKSKTEQQKDDPEHSKSRLLSGDTSSKERKGASERQRDSSSYSKSRLLSGTSYSDRGGRERDSSERRQKPTMSEKGTSDRQEQYRKGEKRSPPVSRRRHDAPPSTGAQSDQFVVEATLQAANISATLSDADLFRMDVFNPLRDINVDISPVEPCISIEELHLQNASIEAYAREQERRDSFPSVDLRNLVQIRVKKSQAQDKLRFRAIYYGLLTQLYTRYFARRLAIKTEMAQKDTSSQAAAQATAGSTVQSQAKAAKKGLLTVIPSIASGPISAADLSQMELAIALKEIETGGPFSDPDAVETVVLGADSDRSLTQSTTSSLVSVFGAQTLSSATIQADTTPEQDKEKTSDTRTLAPGEEKVVDTSQDSIESVGFKRSKRDQTPEPDPDALELHASGSLLPEDMAVDSDSKKKSSAHISKVSIDTSQTQQQVTQPQVSIDKSVTPVGHTMEVETTPPVVSPEQYRIPRIMDTPPRGTTGPIVIKFSNEFYKETEVRHTNMRCGIDFAAIADTNTASNRVRNSDNYFNARTIVPTPIAFRPGMRRIREQFIETMLDPATQQLVRSATSAVDFHRHQKEDFFYGDGRERFPAAAVLAEFAHYGFVVQQAVNMAMISTLGDSNNFALISVWVRIWDMALLCFRAMLAKEDVLCLFEENEFLYFPNVPLHFHYRQMHETFVYFLRYKNRIYSSGNASEHDALQDRQMNQVKKGLAEKWKINLSKVPIGTRVYVQNETLSYQPPIDEMFIGRIPIPEKTPQEPARSREIGKGRGKIKARVGAPVQSEVKEVGSRVKVTTSQPTIGPYQFGTFTEELRQVFSPKDLVTPVYRTYVTAELSSKDIDQHVQSRYKVYQRLLGEIPKEFSLYVEDSRRLKGRKYTILEILELLTTTVQFYGRNNDFEPMFRLVQIWNAILGQLPSNERKEAIACPLGNKFGDVMGIALEFYDNHRKGHPDVRQAEPYAKLYYRQLGDHLRSYLVSAVILQWPKAGDRIPHPENWDDVLELLNLQAERDTNPRSTSRGETPLNIERVKEVSDVQIEMEESPPEEETMERPESQTVSERKSRSPARAMPPPAHDARGRPIGQRAPIASRVGHKLPPLGHGRPSSRSRYFYGRSMSRSSSRSTRGLDSDQFDRRNFEGDYYHSAGIQPGRQMYRGDERKAWYLGKEYTKTMPPRRRSPTAESRRTGSSVWGRDAAGPDRPPTLDEQRKFRKEAQPDISGYKLGFKPQKTVTEVTFDENWKKGEEAVKLFEWASENCYLSAFNRRGRTAQEQRIRMIAGRSCDDLSREQSWIKEQLPNGKPLENPEKRIRNVMMTPLVPKSMQEDPQYKREWNCFTKDIHPYTRECVETMYFLKYMYHPFSDPRVTIIDTMQALEGLSNRIADMSVLCGDSRDFPIIIGFDMEDFSCRRDPNLSHTAKDFGWNGYRPLKWDIEARGNIRNAYSYDDSWRKELDKALKGENCLNWPPAQRRICPIIYQRWTRLNYGRVIQLFTHDHQQYLIDLFQFYDNPVTDVDKIFLRKDKHGQPLQPHEYIPASEKTSGILDMACISTPKRELIGLLTGEKVRAKGGLGVIFVTNNADADFERLQATLGITGSRRDMKQVRDMQEQGMDVVSFVDNDELALACGMQEEWTVKPEDEEAKPQYKKKWSPSAMTLYTFRGNRHLVRIPAEYERQYGLLPIRTRNFDSNKTIVEYLQGRPEMRPQDCERPEFHPHRLLINKGQLADHLNVASITEIPIPILNYVQADAPMSFASMNGLLLLRSPIYSPEDDDITISEELRDNMKLCSEVIRRYFSYPVFFSKRKPDMLTRRQKPKYESYIVSVKDHIRNEAFREWRQFRNNNFRIWPDLWYKQFPFLVKEIEKHCTSPTCPEEEPFLRQVCIVSFIEMWQTKMQLHLTRRIQSALYFGEGIPRLWRPFPDRQLAHVPPMDYRWMDEVQRLRPLPGPPAVRTRDLEMRAVAGQTLMRLPQDSDEESEFVKPAIAEAKGFTTDESEIMDTGEGEEDDDETPSVFPGQGGDQHQKCERFWKSSTKPCILPANPARTLQEVEKRVWSLVEKFQRAEEADMEDREELYGITSTSDLASRAYLVQYKLWKYGKGLLTALMPDGANMVETFILPTILEQSRPAMTAEQRQKYAHILTRIFSMETKDTITPDLRPWYLRELRVVSTTVQLEVLGAAYEDFADFRIADRHQWVGPAIEMVDEPYLRSYDNAAYWLK